MSSIRFTRPAAAVLLLLVGCAESPTQPRKLDSLPRPLTTAETEVIRASNAFAFDLVREVARAQPDDNIFLSPLSASMALGMTMNGAGGGTFDAMAATLGFSGLGRAEINASYRGVLDLLRGLDPEVELHVANSIWQREGFPVEQAFMDTTRRYFDAEVAALDFTDPASLGVINGWVSDATRGTIESILEEIRPNDVMYLINAIYFKGDWTRQFDPADTYDAPFFDASGATQVGTIPMMMREGPIRAHRGDGFTAVDLPYGAGAFSMTIVLPEPGARIDDLLASLTDEGWRGIVDGLEEQEMDIHLPKFRLEYGRSLKDALRALGMDVAFTESADFSGLSPARVFISDVYQKSFVNVDEEGTEAAAVTSVTMRPTSMPPSVVVNRPFLFAIRERLSGAMLFVGRIVTPPTA